MVVKLDKFASMEVGVGCDSKSSQQRSLWKVSCNSFSLRRPANPRLSSTQREMAKEQTLKLSGGGEGVRPGGGSMFLVLQLNSGSNSIIHVSHGQL